MVQGNVGRDADWEIGVSLKTPEKVRKLQGALHAKAKGAPSCRFYLLHDKVYRADILEFAYRLCKTNGGAAGVDSQSFADIAAYGVGRWLGELTEELRKKTYRPQAVRRVWIPKPDGKQRPLGIPTIRDRVVQTAAVIVLEPIFEADLPDEQYAYRPNRSELDAVRKVHSLLNTGHREVVDADLSGYLETSPYYTPAFSVVAKRRGWLSNTLMRRPLRLPRHTCTARSSPRFTRCKTVCRQTPSVRVATCMATYPGGGSSTKRSFQSSATRICQGAPGVTCSPAMNPSLIHRCTVESAAPRIFAAFSTVTSSPWGGVSGGW